MIQTSFFSSQSLVILKKVHLQKPYVGNKDNTYKGWLKSVWEAALGAAGQKEQDVKTYVLMDLRRLPVITHSHPSATVFNTIATAIAVKTAAFKGLLKL